MKLKSNSNIIMIIVYMCCHSNTCLMKDCMINKYLGLLFEGSAFGGANDGVGNPTTKISYVMLRISYI